jgi:hypothetical protein
MKRLKLSVETSQVHILVSYVLLTQLAKTWFYNRFA